MSNQATETKRKILLLAHPVERVSTIFQRCLVVFHRCLDRMVAKLILSCGESFLAGHVRSCRVANRIPSHRSVFVVNVRNVTEAAQNIRECGALIRVIVTRQPQEVGLVVLVDQSSLFNPLRECFCCIVPDRNSPVVEIFDRVFCWNPQDVILRINPLNASALYFCWTYIRL